MIELLITSLVRSISFIFLSQFTLENIYIYILYLSILINHDGKFIHLIGFIMLVYNGELAS
jgi:hypothetical protein